MDKIILRAAARTLAAIGVLLVTMMLALCLIFPSTMMHITYDMGMDGASVRFAMTAYKRSSDILYVAHATETAIGADKYDEVEECGLQFIAHADFARYCEAREKEAEADGLYKQYVYGNIALAQYRMGKGNAALETAVCALDGKFPPNNAFYALALTARINNDGEMLGKINNKIAELREGLSAEDEARLNSLVALLG